MGNVVAAITHLEAVAIAHVTSNFALVVGHAASHSNRIARLLKIESGSSRESILDKAKKYCPGVVEFREEAKEGAK